MLLYPVFLLHHPFENFIKDESRKKSIKGGKPPLPSISTVRSSFMIQRRSLTRRGGLFYMMYIVMKQTRVIRAQRKALRRIDRLVAKSHMAHSRVVRKKNEVILLQEQLISVLSQK